MNAALSLQARPAASRPIRLLIVDDSAVARAMIARMIDGRPEFEVAATVPGAQAALAFLSSARVDTILLDIEMPGMDGLTALPRILEASGGAHVLIVSSSAAEGAAATMKALTLGATDTLAKPGTSAFAGKFADTLVDRLLKMGHAAGDRRGGEQDRTPPPAVRLRPLGDRPIECVAIGSSTGGLRALSDLLTPLPASFAAPILITQHLPAPFMPFFAAQIAQISGRPTAVATDGAALIPGRILVAPGDGHLCVRRVGASVRVVIERERAASGCLPSVDPMLASVGRAYGAGALAVVLTGMGRDGTLAAAGFAEAGGEIVVQDRETSIVWGMPGSIATAGLASAVLRPRQIAELMQSRGHG